MTGSTIIFFILATAIIVFSIASILDRRILRAAIYLLFVLVSIAGLFYLMRFEFLAAVQLILYAGGIVVLIIFSILLPSQINSRLGKPALMQVIPAVLTALAGIGITVLSILPTAFSATTETSIGADMRTIGLQLMDTNIHGYALPFEVISILLLAALVGAIFIARKSDT